MPEETSLQFYCCLPFKWGSIFRRKNFLSKNFLRENSFFQSRIHFEMALTSRKVTKSQKLFPPGKMVEKHAGIPIHLSQCENTRAQLFKASLA